MRTKAVLDGEWVSSEIIDARKHRYIGSFHPPSAFSLADSGVAGVILCTCGQGLWTMDQTHDHWQRGHFDTPQYESLKKKEETNVVQTEEVPGGEMGTAIRTEDSTAAAESGEAVES